MQHQEIAAMIVAAMPCPPLPLVGGQSEDDGDDRVLSSHNLFRQILLHLSYHTPAQARTQHMDLMQKAELELFASLDALEQPLCPKQVYTTYCTFMRAVLTSSPFVNQDVRFSPMCDVVKGDTVHCSVCDHAKAQDVIYEEDNAVDYSSTDYRAIVMQYAYRAVACK
eukprot:3934405-Rhodomonas_salina.6